MSCEAMQIDLSAFVDGEVEPWDALTLADHLLQCPRCADFYRRARRLDWALAHAAPAGVGAVRADGRAPRRLPPALRRSLPVAATILLALGAFALWRVHGQHGFDGSGSAAVPELRTEQPMTDARFVGMTRDLLSAEPRYRREMLRVMLETSARRPLEATVDRRPLPAPAPGEAGREIGNPGS